MIVRFLLAQLHMDSLVDTTTIKSVRTALQRFGRGSNAYGSAYDDAMERINEQSGNRKELALRVLMWITCAKRQLSIRELQHALAVQIDESSLDEDDFVDINDIISVCAGLVTIDEQSNIVRLVHYTTQEYFQRQELQDKWFPAAQDTIFMACTTYLGFEYFAKGSCGDDVEYGERLKQHPFYRYAACKWARHLRLAANIGISELVSFLDASLVNHVDSWRRTPLHHAATEGHVKIVQLLLEKGADTQVLDLRGQSPLLKATFISQTEIVRMLLDMGADPNLHEAIESPLMRAVLNDHDEIVELLIDHKANIEERNTYHPLLVVAVEFACWKALRSLLKKGADTEARDKSGSTALTYAVRDGSIESVRLLLDHGANIYAKNSFGETPLSVTQKPDFDRPKIAQMVLEKAQELCSG